MTPLTKRPAWKALAAHYKNIKPLHLRTLFAADPKRGQRLTAKEVERLTPPGGWQTPVMSS